MKHRFARSLTAGVLTLALPLPALAQSGLYDPAPPAGSAFVRIAGATNGTVAGKAVTAKPGAVSVYMIVPQGGASVTVGGVKQTLKVQAGKFYTVALSGKKALTFNDAGADNRAKALLSVYNLSSGPVDLKTADGKTSVLSGVKAGASDSRAVNGVTVDLAVFSGAKPLSSFKGVQLERGGAYAVVVTDSGATLTQSSTAKVQ